MGSSDDTVPPSRVDPSSETLDDHGGTRTSSVNDPDAFPVPRWDRYEPLGFLGRGGMGAVWKAKDRRLNRVVALKFIRGIDPELTMRFVQEARAQARIDHPGVCKVFEVGEVGDRAYIAMQLLSGERLDKAARGLSLLDKVAVVRDVARAMHEAHKLGVIHRDLKPSNILVERAEDGRPMPVVMDFGLARETNSDMALTRTGALIGTPAYMSPEQASGSGDIDRRSDVYSLGATLYELLAGEPPFVEPTLAMMVHRVIADDPPSLRGRLPQLPRDLDTICMKCLRKEPAARYDSARGLADDLQRYIDGDAIVGARQSLWERAARKARRHRAVVAVSAVSFVLIAVAGAFGLRSLLVARATEQRAAERSRLAERLGQDVKEIEWFLRTASTLPLHDMTAEHKLIRERMARIAAQADEGAVHYALGRAHLALHEEERALEELDRARAMGVETPELHFARGKVLGELYHRAMEKARAGGDKAWLAAEQNRLKAQYLAPALESLEKSRGVELESPRYLEGLIALYRHDHDAATRAADDAVKATPWLAETYELGADAAYARATDALDRGAYEPARAAFVEAVARYEKATGIARSDGTMYQSLAEAWMGKAEVDRREGRAAEQMTTYEHALEAARNATEASPSSSPAHTTVAFAHLRVFRSGVKRSDEERGALLDSWLAAARRAVELDPRNALALDALGNAHLFRALHEWRRARDAMPAFADAETSLSRAIELEPRFPWALNDLGLTYMRRALLRQELGRDFLPDLAAAARSFERAVATDPLYLFALVNLVEVYGHIAHAEVERGQDPTAHVRRAAEVGERGLTLDPNFFDLLREIAFAELAEASYLSTSGKDPTVVINRALSRLDRAASMNPTDVGVQLYRVRAQHLRAETAIREGRDPGDAFADGRRAFRAAVASDPTCAECRLWGARLALIEGRWARGRGKSAGGFLTEGITEVDRALVQTPGSSEALELRAALLRELQGK